MKPKWKVILLLFGIVLVSGLCGAAVGAKITQRAIHRHNNPAAWNEIAMRVLQNRLKLTPEQVPKVQAILESGVEEMKGIRLDAIARTNTVIERLTVEIDKEILPEQRAEFDKFKAEHHEATLDMLKARPAR
ncbi:MAG: hypothetical protein JWL59_3259 [Chthoniobacteraceae bacterium]|nr:hypothetical protein [Chthoniobacteraceae bacterium]